MPSRIARSASSFAVIAAITLACSGGDRTEVSTDSAAADTAATTDATPAPATSTAPSGPASLTVDDIDRWQKGMQAELEAVREAGKQLASAKTTTDTLNAISAANDMSTRAEGARAAGVDEERYQLIRNTLSSVVGQMAPLEQEMDVSQMPAATVAEMKKSREAGLAQATSELSPSLVEALRERAAELRKQDLTLTAERLKASGIAR